MQEGSCQKSDHGFTCICPSGGSGARREINTDGRAGPELNLDLGSEGGICVHESGHTFYCRSVFLYLKFTRYVFRKAYKHPSNNAL